MTTKQEIISVAQAGQALRARQLAEAHAAENPGDVDAWFLLASLESVCGSEPRLEGALRRVIALSPEHRDAHYNLGVLLQHQNRAAEATAEYRRILQGAPHAEAQANLGLLLLEQGAVGEALQLIESAVQLAPQLAEAHLNLGMAYARQERLVEAQAAFKRVVQLQPDNARAYQYLGLCFEAAQQPDKGQDAYEHAIALAPDNAENYFRLGRLFSSRGELAAACSVYEAALQHRPDSIDLLLALGHVRSQAEASRGEFAQAMLCYDRALAINPDDARIFYALGWLEQTKGNADAALAHYRKALALKSDYEEAIAGVAAVLERQGEIDNAHAAIAPFKGRESAHTLILLADAQLASSDEAREKAAVRLAARAEKEDNRNWRCDLHFALGKLLDELKRYDDAFEHYRRGNDIERVAFDVAANEDLFRRIRSIYQMQAVASLPRATNRSELPIFIVGMPRSGTSLVEQIIASHPQAYGAGELTAINNIMAEFDRLSGTGVHFPESAQQVSIAMLDTIADKHLAYLAGLGGGALRVTDKMPHNFMCLGLIEQLFPHARIIHCLRDPVDTCLSIYFQHFNVHHPYANDLDALGRYFRQYEVLMAHWRSVLNLPLLELRYEELVSDQERMSRKLLEFCGLPWDDACLRFYAAKRTVNTPSYDQVRKPIYKQSVARWKRYEKHIGALLAALEIPSRS